MSSKEFVIHIIMTGGTIDSYYEGTKDTAVPNKKSVIPNFIKNLKLYNNFRFTEICMKDSRELNRTDLKNILNIIEKSPHKLIIVTHGTYTMSNSGKFLREHLKRKDQTIVFTGSMIPLIGFSPSDAPFNLGFAIAKVKELKSGIYICMNGKVFSPVEAVKLLREGRFISIFGEK